jgi:hypothetical protein
VYHVSEDCFCGVIVTFGDVNLKWSSYAVLNG